MSRVPKGLRRQSPRKDQEERELEERSEQRLDSIEVITPQHALRENREEFTGLNLGAGDYRGFTITNPQTRVRGLSTRVRVTAQWTIEDDCMIDDIHFVGSTGSLIEIDSGEALFRGCYFQKTAGTSLFINVAAAARASFLGCWWEGFAGIAAGSPIINAGAAARVQVVGGLNSSGNAFAGVTVTGALV